MDAWLVRAVSKLGTAETARSLAAGLDDALRSRMDAMHLAKTPRLRTRVSPRRGARNA